MTLIVKWEVKHKTSGYIDLYLMNLKEILKHVYDLLRKEVSDVEVLLKLYSTHEIRDLNVEKLQSIQIWWAGWLQGIIAIMDTSHNQTQVVAFQLF